MRLGGRVRRVKKAASQHTQAVSESMQVPELKQGRRRPTRTKTLAKLRMQSAQQARVAQKARLPCQLIVGIDEKRERSLLQGRTVGVLRQIPSSAEQRSTR